MIIGLLILKSGWQTYYRKANTLYFNYLQNFSKLAHLFAQQTQKRALEDII